MTDNLSPYKPLDPGRIDAVDEVEIKYWCEQLHCSEKELRDAMAAVGDHVTAVRERLGPRK